MKHRKAYILACAIITLVGVLAYFSDRPPEQTVSNPSGTSAPLQARTDTISGALPLVQSPAPRSPLGAAYLGASSLRPFVEEAKTKPELGGIWYARTALLECAFASNRANVAAARTAASRETDASLRQLRSSAIDTIERRCSDFSLDELTHDATKQLRSLRNADKDPLMAASDASGKAATAGDKKAYRDALGQQLKLLDPVYLSQTVPFPFNPKSPYFNGIAYPEDAFSDLRLAWELMSCRLGADCGPQHLAVVRACAMQGKCGLDFLRLAKEIHSSRPVKLQFDEVVRLSNKMAEAAAAGRVDAFLPLP